MSKTAPTCRFCGTELHTTMVDLGMSPPSENFLLPAQSNERESFYPLVVRVCGDCYLVQLEEYVDPQEIFDDYAYFSSFSSAWLTHARTYVDDMTRRFGLSGDSFVIEVASNDGYLLQNFVERDIPCLGIEPARTVADAAIEKGVPTRQIFFDEQTALGLSSEGIAADLIAANNVLAQVADLNSFVGGFRHVLADQGVLTIEFPHLQTLLDRNEFDTIYHEHYSYFSMGTTKRILGAHGLRVFDVEELWTHGGSLRVYACLEEASHVTSTSVEALIDREREAGMFDLASYPEFEQRARRIKRELLKLLIDARERGLHVAAYGAPGKGNTLLNYCGIRTDLIDYAVDRNPYKHGRLTPGTHIPIHPPELLADTRPDLIVILPWNLREEIAEQLEFTREWGARLVVPIPEVEVF